MAKLVKEIRSPELFSLAAHDAADSALAYLLALGISSAPVVDAQGTLCGMVSLRDLIAERQGAMVRERMSTPPIAVRDHDSIKHAGELIGNSGCHHLPVVDERGHPVGMVSSLDVIRGLLGMPAVHPATSPHYDPDTGVAWSDDHIFDQAHVSEAPKEPGVFVLIRGGMGVEETIQWAESAQDLRARLEEITCAPESQTLRLQRVLAFRELRYRTASVANPVQRERLATMLLGRMSAS